MNEDREVEEVREVCERLGYGNVRSIALNLWAESMKRKYGIEGFRLDRLRAEYEVAKAGSA